MYITYMVYRCLYWTYADLFLQKDWLVQRDKSGSTYFFVWHFLCLLWDIFWYRNLKFCITYSKQNNIFAWFQCAPKRSFNVCAKIIYYPTYMNYLYWNTLYALSINDYEYCFIYFTFFTSRSINFVLLCI